MSEAREETQTRPKLVRNFCSPSSARPSMALGPSTWSTTDDAQACKQADRQSADNHSPTVALNARGACAHWQAMLSLAMSDLSS
jgi:hypothetical protein